MDMDKVERLRERLLQCSVCMEEFKDPRILPCHHTLCFECISSVVQSSVTGRCFRCPQCRSDIVVPKRGIQDLPINFYIVSLQDELGTRGYSGTCNICERDWLVSQFHCIDCDLDICRFCIHAHRLETHSESPKILRIETTASTAQLASNRPCGEHADEILQVYCTTCNQPICVTCSCTTHKRHNVTPIGTKLQESKSFLQSELDRLTAEKRKALKTANDLEKVKEEFMEVSNRALLSLDGAAHQACELIMKKKSEIEKEILSEERKQNDGIQGMMDSFKTYVQQIDRGLGFLLDLQDNDICLEVVDTYKEFSDKLKAKKKSCTQKHIGIKHQYLTLSKYARVSDVNTGLHRHLFYHGKLGSLSSERFCLYIDPKKFEIQKQLKGLSPILGSIYFKKFMQFLVTLLLFQTFFYLCEVSGTFDQITWYMKYIYAEIIILISHFFY